MLPVKNVATSLIKCFSLSFAVHGNKTNSTVLIANETKIGGVKHPRGFVHTLKGQARLYFHVESANGQPLTLVTPTVNMLYVIYT